MASITTRGSKGTPLTHNEVDANFSNLNSDKLDTAGIALGSAASPTIKFTGDTNTGIYSPGADQVAVCTGGTGRLFVNSSGNVGIGTSSPGSALQVNGSSALGWGSGDLALGFGAPNITLKNTDTTNSNAAAIFLRDSGDYKTCGINFRNLTHGVSGSSDISFVTRNGGTLQSEALVISSGGTSTFTSAATTSPAIFKISTSEVARIDTVGRLLIGTSTAPTFNASTAPLNVAHGNVHAASFIRYSANEFGSFFGIGKSRNATPGSHTAVINGDTLGIISFFGSNGTDFSNQAAQILGQVDAEPFTAGDTTDLPGRLVFSTTADGASTPTERMRITSAGNVGIGTSSPGAKLDVVGSSRVIGTTTDVPTFILQAGSGVTDGFSRGTIDFLNQAGTSGYRLRGAHDGGVFQILTNASGTYTERISVADAGTTTFTSNASTAPFIAKISTTEVARIDSSGRLLVGTSSSTALLSYNSGAQFAAADGTISAIRNSANTGSPEYVSAKSRGSASSPSVVLDGDGLWLGRFAGYDGSAYVESARISAVVDGTPGTNDMPGRLVFSTTADGASSPTERMRITQQGVIAYNQAAPATCNTSATITAADLTNRIITSSTTAAAVAMTLPTGTDTENAFSGLYNNFTFEFCVINTGSNTLTVTTNTGWTLTGNGNMVVAANTTNRFAARRTAANTWSLYCVG